MKSADNFGYYGNLYIDTGSGFSETQRVTFFFDDVANGKTINIPSNAIHLRYDPVESLYCKVIDLEIKNSRGIVTAISINGEFNNGIYVFNTLDPQFLLDVDKDSESWINIRAKIELSKVNEDYLKIWDKEIKDQLKSWYEPELDYLKLFIPNEDSTVIDIGANVGLYTYFFERLCKNVHSFEPIPFLFDKLKNIATFYHRINAYNCALSDCISEMELHIPEKMGGGGGMITAESTLAELSEPHITIQVPVKTLDSFKFNNVSLIKIDVEGHELKTINGALKTIKKYKPVLIVEIESRHLQRQKEYSAMKSEDVIDYICSLGYNGYFIRNKELTAISQFNSNTMQVYGSHPYYFNFIFISKENILRRILKKLHLIAHLIIKK